jgi:tetratricopeptide (TPR) repeat protein
MDRSKTTAQEEEKFMVSTKKFLALSLLTWIFVLSCPVFSGAEISNTHLLKAIEYYNQEKYTESLSELELASKTADTNSKAENLEIYKYFGFIYSIYEDESGAIKWFMKMLQVNCDYQLTERELMVGAINRNYQKSIKKFGPCDKVAPMIDYIPPVELPALEGNLEVNVQITDNNKVQKADMYYKSPIETTFRQQPLSPSAATQNTYVAQIYLADKTVEELSYYFQATDTAGNKTRFPSNPREYLQVKIEYQGKSMFTKRNIGWGSVGLGVVTGVLGGIMMPMAVSKANTAIDEGNRADYDSAKSTYTIGMVMLGLTAALEGTGIYCLTTSAGGQAQRFEPAKKIRFATTMGGSPNALQVGLGFAY